MSTGNSHKNTHFWDTYRSALLQKSISGAKADWYLKWAQRFALSAPGSLKSRTPSHINAFLDKLASQAGIAEWQVAQACEALRILYKDILDVPWAQQWPDGARPILEESGLPPKLDEKKRPSATRPTGYAAHTDIFDRLHTEMRTRHYSIRTERSYEHWVRRFIAFHGLKSPKNLRPDSVREYLEYLAEVREISASTQNQALNALVFLYEHVLQEPLGSIGDFTKAKRPQRLPVVLTREEVDFLLKNLTGVKAIMAGLLYGSGLRLMECLRLRVKDVDFSQQQIVVRDGKGQKDRITMLPADM
jgi:Phage integrase, N-terminal SAM-like domain/Phage integrase family